MDSHPSVEYSDRLNAFMTTEHSTLQSARSIINGEIMNRITIYFTTLSSVLIAGAFLAQLPELGNLFRLFLGIAFPVTILLGIFTLARLMVLGRMDLVYIRAINRIRQYYLRATPEMGKYLLFPPYDDDRSTRMYGGYAMDFRGNLLSAAQAVTVTNTIVATVFLSMLISPALGMTALSFLPFGLVMLVPVYILHGLLGVALSKMESRPEYEQVRFPAPMPDSHPN